MGSAANTGNARLRQREQTIGLHAQQRHTARHILQFTVWLGPLEQFAQPARQRCTPQRWVLLHQTMYNLDVVVTELATAVDIHPANSRENRRTCPAVSDLRAAFIRSSASDYAKMWVTTRIVGGGRRS